MTHNKEFANGVVEWRIKMSDGSSETLVPKAGLPSRLWHCLWAFLAGLTLKLWTFLKKAWELGKNEPKKVIHCLKVGMVLTAVSLFYYMRPLYDGVGGNAMWAIMTVVVVFENTAGATICKTFNRVCGTCLAGLLAIGVHWVANQAGDKFEPFIVDGSLFLFASAATFSRFIPTVKARFDYGAMIFILTFSLVSVSGYRVDNLWNLAYQRISTVIIGTSLCIIISMVICPIWAGEELNVLISRNMDKLAASLDGSVSQYFDTSTDKAENDKESETKLLGHKCVLASKATEESMANFARWEPAHGRFNFRHPWKQYLKIGASMRCCAACMDALIACINSENKAPEHIKNHMNGISMKVSTKSAKVMRELATSIKTMKKSSSIDVLVAEMKVCAEELQEMLKYSHPIMLNDRFQYHCSTALKVEEGYGYERSQTEKAEPPSSSSTNNNNNPILGIIQVVTVASLLTQIAGRVQSIVNDVEQLAELAEFKPPPSHKSNHTKTVSPDHQFVHETKKNELQMVQ